MGSSRAGGTRAGTHLAISALRSMVAASGSLAVAGYAVWIGDQVGGFVGYWCGGGGRGWVGRYKGYTDDLVEGVLGKEEKEEKRRDRLGEVG